VLRDVIFCYTGTFAGSLVTMVSSFTKRPPCPRLILRTRDRLGRLGNGSVDLPEHCLIFLFYQ